VKASLALQARFLQQPYFLELVLIAKISFR
jgi:hypothetical protein